jgi:hypothetical protein
LRGDELIIKLQSLDTMKYFITQDALEIDSEEAAIQMASYRN